jgi:hypothetical protein
MAESDGKLSCGSAKGGLPRFGIPRLIRAYNVIAACAFAERLSEVFVLKLGRKSRFAIQKQLTVRPPQEDLSHIRFTQFAGR